jgi:hypothetical protein
MPFKCCIPDCNPNYGPSSSNYVPVFKFPSNEETKRIWKDILKIEDWRISKSSHVCAKHFKGTAFNPDKMKRLVSNAVPMTSNYVEITLSEEIIKISNDDTITIGKIFWL